MIDPIIFLAFSIYSKKGIYALLLGSGVSRGAGIPTGWEIVLDLIRKLAATINESCDPNPVEWYISKYSEEPDYSRILEYITKSATVRNQILRSYFEPDDEEREQGLKMPTQAHKSIANMVKSGFIRVILTTNFDRLIETALEEAGITPTVINTPDAIKGALPLTHTECTVIKLHGDYLDTRIKNSSKELEKYSQPLSNLLDRIFDEYGLVLCGWSAEWDTALREALQRCKSHRFQTFWTIRGEQKDKTKKLIQFRWAEEIIIKDADTFFKELEQKVLALQEFDKPHPLSVPAAVTTLKKYLRDDSQEIYLHDMVIEEVEKLYQKLSPENFPVKNNPNANELLKRMQLYDSYTETLLAIMINGCYWGKKSHEDLWIKCLQRIANPLGKSEGGYNIWNNLRLYPGLLLLYGGGMGSIIAEKYPTFYTLLYKPTIRLKSQEFPAVFRLITDEVIEPSELSQVGISQRTFLSDNLLKVLREPFRIFLPSEIDYQKYFDRFEYLLAIIFADFWNKQTQGNTGGTTIWGPVGNFVFRRYYGEKPESLIPAKKISEEIEREQLEAGDKWWLLKAGLFDGSSKRFQFIKKEFDNWVREAYAHYHIHF